MYYLNNCRFDFKERNSNMHYPPFMAKCTSWQFQLYKLIFMAFICFFFNRNFRIVIKYIVKIFAFLKVKRYFLKKKSRNSTLQILEIWILNWMYCDSKKKHVQQNVLNSLKKSILLWTVQLACTWVTFKKWR